ncbi:MAG: HAD-IIB family hydrolase [Gammaproteobacteria bacterium]|nr:HAD-IIB family hydrolase [Gammaproteobacteria bacterium]MCW8928224.1 HAD-IIB family hydrolase [Gammaproteobacteria bacterium]MCW8958596.1 HAD-IIB family hydrolase [Gammaproteobacteria bacterium]MCW8972399.1 HAD-IIB family hydrolase [Gammaproteobacteria bacterium]MCW8992649.1 HAD-IIB family hydrolase [Gammaproteobacteria bacterium]
MEKRGLYVVMVSVHGLIRGHNMELGRDADTGGQIKYVVELARALAEHPDVERVDLLTRQVFDPKVDNDYAEPEEKIGDKARIIRLPAGPRRYFRKEVLWPYLEAFADEALQHLRRVGQVPDYIHSHYADAGYVGARLSQLLGVPLVHTGHSLGVDKRRRLEDKGVLPQNIERNYNMSTRIEAEEITLGNAALVIASTSQEIEQQYKAYDNYHPKRMRVIPPGVDISRFQPPTVRQKKPAIAATLERFLSEPKRPMVLAISRADERKNIATLVRAYAENPDLREAANLVVVAGNRDDIRKLEKGAREVLSELLLLIDRYDLYGKVAYPKHHEPNDIPDLYRLAAQSRGVFVNPALTEPFGLTLIEAAASGVPLVATEDGGPCDIMRHCKSGYLVDPLDADTMGEKIYEVISSKSRWQRLSRAGIKGARSTYTWGGHVETYLSEVRSVLGKMNKAKKRFSLSRSRLPTVDRVMICDIDNTLLGDRDGLKQLLRRLKEAGDRVAFGVATGRRLDSALKVLDEWGVPMPDLLITSVGSEIHYGNGLVEDQGWARHINYQWKPETLKKALVGAPGLRLQPKVDQRRFKLSYFVDPEKMPNVNAIRTCLRKRDLHCKLIYSHQSFLDLLPIRASKGLAIRYLMMKWGLAPDRLLVAGDSGNDIEMLRGETLGVVVGNYSPEVESLVGEPRIYFAEGEYATGILEGTDHYDFFGEVSTCDGEEGEE